MKFSDSIKKVNHIVLSNSKTNKTLKSFYSRNSDEKKEDLIIKSNQ